MTIDRSAARQDAVAQAGARRPRRFERPTGTDGAPMRTSEYFGSLTFNFELMERVLPAADVQTMREHATAKEPLARALADKVAAAVKEWALGQGATHYCHWFQPQTGSTAEKHDSFFSFDRGGMGLEAFTGAQLVQGEPDASSFPSGGMRATFEARGYTAWDSSSPMFLMATESGLTLCIPSVFCSYSGDALDEKTPLLRSLAAVSEAAVASLKLLGHDSKHVVATAGPEQEYFLVDEALHNLRPDLVLAGRTLFGKTPARHQQLEDHYFGSIKPRALNFMMECDYELYRLGVPIKTRHNEVAPSQYEFAPIFETANVAADHNQLMMEVIKSVARRHHFVALFHEKPYAGINGSGKHVNWSLADASGHNLLEPGDKPHDNIRFLFFLSATVKAVHDHAKLLRMAIATPGNDFRLGANEAPPAIISVFLGETLHDIFERLVQGPTAAAATERQSRINLDLAKVPLIHRDNTDRNRTSPFAFTGNKFEFRAVGASASISLPLVMVNAAVATALRAMNERLLKMSGGSRPSDEQVLELIMQVVKETKKIRFEGDNYSADWHKEAEARGLPNLRTTPEALRILKEDGTQELLSALGIMSPGEAKARYNVRLERFNKTRLIELETLLELLSTQVLPTAFAYQAQVAGSLAALKGAGIPPVKTQEEALQVVAALTGSLIAAKGRLSTFIERAGATHDEEAQGALLAGDGMQLMSDVRGLCNDTEALVDDALWALPKYREILYLL